MLQREIVLCNPLRTAIGTYNGSLKATPATDLGAAVMRETLKRSGLDAGRLGAVVRGTVIQAGNKMNPAFPRIPQVANKARTFSWWAAP